MKHLILLLCLDFDPIKSVAESPQMNANSAVKQCECCVGYWVGRGEREVLESRSHKYNRFSILSMFFYDLYVVLRCTILRLKSIEVGLLASEEINIGGVC